MSASVLSRVSVGVAHITADVPSTSTRDLRIRHTGGTGFTHPGAVCTSPTKGFAMTRYTVIVNRPGYMPESVEPYECDTLSEAVDCATTEIEDSASVDSLHYRGDWQSALRDGAPVHFIDDIDGQIYVVQIVEVTA